VFAPKVLGIVALIAWMTIHDVNHKFLANKFLYILMTFASGDRADWCPVAMRTAMQRLGVSGYFSP
jgi:hypothetical protein